MTAKIDTKALRALLKLMENRVRFDDGMESLISAAPALLDAAEENEKYRTAANVLCAAHIGLPQASCPVCERDALRAELSWIDSVLARRPALDKPTRAANIERAINVAKQADALKAEVAKLQLSASDVEFHGNGRSSAHRTPAATRRPTDMNNHTEQVIDEIKAERVRQQSAEGWTVEHDDKHTHGDLAFAAGCYATCAAWQECGSTPSGAAPQAWPWGMDGWNPKDARRNLVRAAALIVAEIERLDRKAKAEASRG